MILRGDPVWLTAGHQCSPARETLKSLVGFKSLKWMFLDLIDKEFIFFTDTDVYIQIFNFGVQITWVQNR